MKVISLLLVQSTAEGQIDFILSRAAAKGRAPPMPLVKLLTTRKARPDSDGRGPAAGGLVTSELSAHLHSFLLLHSGPAVFRRSHIWSGEWRITWRRCWRNSPGLNAPSAAAWPSPAAATYFFEMLGALQTADDITRFLHPRPHRGITRSFLLRDFSRRIRCRAEVRGAPDLKYTRSWAVQLPCCQRPPAGAQI